MSKNRGNVSRRAFMKTLGGAAACLPAYNLMKYAMAYGSAGTPPLRLIMLWNPHGTSHHYWKPRPTAETPGLTEFALNASSLTFQNSILAPLDHHRSKLLVLDGIDYRVLFEKGNTGHEGAAASSFTGSRSIQRDGWYYPGGPSIDQYLASKLGGGQKFRSLVLGVQSPTMLEVIFGPGGVPVPGEIDPRETYRRLFGNGTTDSAKKLGVLDYLKGEVGSLGSRLTGAEKAKLDLHLNSLSEIERGIGSISSCTSPPEPSLLVATPPQPADVNTPEKSHKVAIQEGKNVQTVTRMQMKLIAQAFACDLTRFASLSFSGLSQNCSWMGFNDSAYNDVHNSIAHMVDWTTPTAAVNLKLAKFQKWFAEQVAYLMDELASIPEGSGSVLDNTLIVWGNEFNDTAGHSCINIPIVLAGGAAGKFRMGRCVRYSTALEADCSVWWTDYPGPLCQNTDSRVNGRYSKQTSHNQLLVSILRAFGLNDNYFNDPDYTGPLPDLV